MKKAILWGFGALGRAIAVAGAEIGGIEIVGIIDRSPDLVGTSPGALMPGWRFRIQRNLGQRNRPRPNTYNQAVTPNGGSIPRAPTFRDVTIRR